MRDIAFRAWTEFKTMVDVPTVNFATSEALMPDGEWYKVELMQYTGLKDKNGVEIYEGDIVTHLSFGNQIIDSVIWSKEGLWLLGDSMYQIGVYTGKYGDNTVEVIGNRFEHPHLLEGDHNSNSNE